MKSEFNAPVSVVIPCFRCEFTIHRAVASVLAQTWRPAEVILVDDASGPATSAALADLAQAHPGWIKVITLAVNQGAGGARNAGWAVATQDFVAFLDADDTWHPDKVALQCAFMTAHPDVALSGHAHEVRIGVPAQAELLSRHWLDKPSADALLPVSISKLQMLISNRFITPSVMIRRDIKMRFAPGRRHMEDHLLWLEVVCNGGKLVRLSAELAAIYKPAFGVSGLSSQMWKMACADFGNYGYLYRQRHLSTLLWVLFSGLSIVKFGRRLLIQIGRQLRAFVAAPKG